MKIEPGKTGSKLLPAARLVLFIILLMNIHAVIYAGGNRGRTEPIDPGPINTPEGTGHINTPENTRRLIWASSERPSWVDEVPQSATEFYFVGTSQPYDTASNARDNSRENARSQVLKFYGEHIERQAIESGSMSGVTGDTFEAFVVREDEIRSYAENIISQISTDRYYTELFLNSNNRQEYEVYTLSQISRQKFEEDIANFAHNISQRYAALITPKSTLKTTLEAYVSVLRALEQNPLHRVTAYHDGAAGRVGLYGYVLSEINELVNSIEISTLLNRTVQRPDTLETIVRFNSSQMPVLGPFDCRVSILGMNIDVPAVRYALSNDNSFFLQILTANLEPGRYTVQIEMLLHEITGNTGNNVSGGFSFEVTPLAAVFRTRTEMEEGIKKAVDTLASGLSNQTDTRIGSFLLTGTETHTGLSRFLTERITHYAVNNPDRKYRVVRENIGTENNQIAFLTGFYARRGDQADVTLELFTPDGNGNGSQFFSISAALLAELGIEIEPNIPPTEPFPSLNPTLTDETSVTPPVTVVPSDSIPESEPIQPQGITRNASLSFAGNTVSARDRQIIIFGLRDAMQTFSVNLFLDENNVTAAGYSFNITIFLEQISIFNSTYQRAEVIITFSQGPLVLCQTGPNIITVPQEYNLADEIVKRLRSDNVFFNRVNEALRQER